MKLSEQNETDLDLIANALRKSCHFPNCLNPTSCPINDGCKTALTPITTKMAWTIADKIRFYTCAKGKLNIAEFQAMLRGYIRLLPFFSCRPNSEETAFSNVLYNLIDFIRSMATNSPNSAKFIIHNIEYWNTEKH